MVCRILAQGFGLQDERKQSAMPHTSTSWTPEGRANFQGWQIQAEPTLHPGDAYEKHVFRKIGEAYQIFADRTFDFHLHCFLYLVHIVLFFEEE